MSNTIKIKHGETVPTMDDLQPYELGYHNQKLYINNGHKISSLTGDQVTVVTISFGSSSSDFKADYTYEEIYSKTRVSPVFLIYFGKVFVCIGSPGFGRLEFVQLGLTSLTGMEKFTVNSDNVWTRSNYSLA